MDSPNLNVIKDLWAVFDERGYDECVEAFFARCHPNAVFRPYASEDQVFEGVAAYRTYIERQRSAGTIVEAEADSFEEEGDEVHVLGWLRVRRDEGLSDTTLCWVYTFRDGLITAFRVESQIRADSACAQS